MGSMANVPLKLVGVGEGRGSWNLSVDEGPSAHRLTPYVELLGAMMDPGRI